jgi:PAS domain S-box-containing protein
VLGVGILLASGGLRGDGLSGTPAETVSEAWAIAQETGIYEVEMDLVYLDRAWRVGWLAGRDGAVDYLELRDDTSLKAGTRLRLRSREAFRGAVREADLDIAVLGEAMVPPLAFPGFGAEAPLSPGYYHFEALVNEIAEVDPTHSSIDLAVGDRSVPAFLLRRPGDSVPNVTSHRVSFPAVLIPGGDRNDPAAGVRLWIASADDLAIHGPLGTDPAFQRERVMIGDLGEAPPDQLVRLEGTVREAVPGDFLVLEDASGEATIRTGQTHPWRRGEPIEVVGYPRRADLAWTLTSGRVRSLATDRASRVQQGVPVLRSARSILSLPRREIEAIHPLALTAVVTAVLPEAGQVFVVDSTAGITLEWPADEPFPVVGMGLNLAGTTAWGADRAVVRVESVAVLRPMALPTPREVSHSQIVNGMEMAQWVEVRGYLRDVPEEGERTILRLVLADGELRVRVPPAESWKGRIGAILSLQGVLTTELRAGSPEAVPLLVVAESERAEVVVEPLVDPFSEVAPATTVAWLKSRSSRNEPLRWRRLRGVVTYSDEERLLYLQEGTEALAVLPRGQFAVAPDAAVELIGLPGWERGRAVLREAHVRPTGDSPGVRPLALSPDAALDRDLQGRLVEIEGRLVRHFEEEDSIHLAIEFGRKVVGVRFPAVALADARVPSVGSLLEVRGIYLPGFDEASQLSNFTVLGRAPEDLSVVEAASWWTARRIGFLAIFLSLTVVGGLAWVVSLRRRVRAQTQEIRSRLESERELMGRHSQIVANASDVIFTTTLDGRFLTINPRGERLLGIPAGRAPQFTFADFFFDEVGGCAQLPPVSAQASNLRCEVRAEGAKSTWVEISVRGFFEEGIASGFLGIARDISAQREYEAALREARSAAEENARAKSAFLANMSHEIRTPMNGVIGMSDLILETDLDHEQESFARIIRESADSLLTILNDILDFSKIEAGKLSFEHIPFDLVETVEGTLEILAPKALEKRLELAVDLPEELPSAFLGDPGRLRQVMLNLVGNAIKFTSAGEVIIVVRVKEYSPSRGLVRIEVRDTGIGLSEEAQAKLFRAFEQADTSTTRKFGGTGLGLAIARQIVELWGGRIGVESAPGKGSTFWFELPTPYGNREDPAHGAPRPAALDGVRALVVDDNATNRRILERYLAAWGMEVETAEDAREALRAVERAAEAARPFEFVLLDFHMPEVDGTELAGWLHARPDASHRKVLLLSSLDFQLTAEGRETFGLCASLTKPIRRRVLRQTLASLHGEALAERAERASVEVEKPGEGLRALVAEDNPVNQRVARLQLERLGFVVEVAIDGREALEMVGKTSFDVVLMDCQMPRMDGYEATVALRERGFADLAIVAMTAHAMEGDRDRCLEVGMDEYVSKPMRPPELRQALARAGVFARRRARPVTWPMEAGRD